MQIPPRRFGRLGHRAALVLGVTALLAGTGGAAAFALSGHGFGSSTDSGNAQPIDDNHPSAPPTPSPAAPAAVPASVPAAVPAEVPARQEDRTAPTTTPTTTRAEDRGRDDIVSRPKPGDDRSGTAEPGDDMGRRGGSGSGSDGDSDGGGGHGSDG